MKLVNEIEFTNLGDERGDLVSLEQNKNIPFEIKRVYYLVNTAQGMSRGYHAHKKLKQILVCIKGSCEIILDDSLNRERVVLNNFFKGIYIDSLIWREMHHFSDDCVLLVVASEHYDESDYIRDYNQFLRLARGE